MEDMAPGSSSASEDAYEFILVDGEVTINGEVCITKVYQRVKKERKTFQVDKFDIEAIQGRYNDHLGKVDVYQIRHIPKGKILLLNNEFRGGNSIRVGSKLDVENMKTVWEQLDCEVIVLENLTSTQIMENIDGFLNATDENVDFLAVFIMSHGEIGDIVVGNDGTRVYVKEIIQLFRNKPQLNGKPKLLFCQMCRGKVARRPDNENPDFGENWIRNALQTAFPEGRLVNAAVDRPDATPFAHAVTTVQPEYVKQFPDMMVSFATMPGEMSFRNEEFGSWFIDAIATVYCAMAKDKDVLEMMKQVRVDVFSRRANCPDSPNIHGSTSLCEISQTLNKKLYFYPGIKPGH